MTLILDRDPFLSAVQRIAGVVDRRATIPVITHFAVDPAEGGVRLTATNLDLQVTTFCAAHGDIGAFTLPAQTTLDALSNLPAGAQIALSRDETDPRIILKSGRSRFKLPTLPRDGIPSLPAPDAPAMTMAAADLARAFGAVSYAASTEQVRFIMTGIFVDNGREFVATDSNSMACARIDAEGETGSAILAAAFVREAVRLCGSGDAELAISDAGSALTVGDTQLIGKVIEGAYVDYRGAKPRSGPALTIGREAMIAAVRRALIVAADKNRSIRLNIGADGVVTIMARNAESGEADNEIEAQWSGEPVTIRINGERLVNMLSHMTGETVEIQIAAENKPVLIEEGDRWAAAGVLRG